MYSVEQAKCRRFKIEVNSYPVWLHNFVTLFPREKHRNSTRNVFKKTLYNFDTTKLLSNTRETHSMYIHSQRIYNGDTAYSIGKIISQCT